MSNVIKNTITAIGTAIAALGEGWDWAQDFADAEGERHIIDGEEYIDTLPDEVSREAAREYAESVNSAYAAAQEHAEMARRELAAGDVPRALEHLEEAARYERQTGDDAAMAEPLRLVEGLVDQED